MDVDIGNLVLFFLGLFSIFIKGDGADCRGSELDSSGRSWIEMNRPLPAEDLNYIAVRFCRAEPILLQIWEPQENNKYKLLWQRELQPDESYLGQVQVFPVPEPFALKTTYRYGMAGKGIFPVETMFDGDRRMDRLSIYSEDDGTFSAGEIKEFAELSRPVYFHVWFCKNRDCPTEEELIYTYEKEMGLNPDDRVRITPVPPDPCRTESLHPASGRIMLEEHNTFMPKVAKAVEFYLCEDTVFHLQLWEPMEGREYKLVWSKDVIPDSNSGGGFKRTVPLNEEEIVYLQPYYRLSLHVPDENSRIPIPSIFSYSENVVFSERKKEKFHRCETELFEEVAFPYNFRIRFCTTIDCTESDKTWTSDDPLSLDALPSIECPEVITDLPNTTTQIPENNAQGDDTQKVTTVTDVVVKDTEATEDASTENDKDDKDINRTKVEEDGSDTPENELEVPVTPKKSRSSATSVIVHINLLTATMGCWLALL